MKVGITLGGMNPSLWVEASKHADRLGYESAWLSEHIVVPVSGTGSPTHGEDHPPVPPDVATFDVWVFIGHLAAVTEQLRFGTNVFNVGLRHPFVIARALTTADIVSNGRVEFGIGVSWLREEWQALGMGDEFDRRGKKADEALDILRALWSEETVEFHGEHFDFGPVQFRPMPVQPGGPPIVVGGDAPVTLRRAARLGSGWLPMNHSLEQIPPAVQKLRQLTEEAGRTDRVELTLQTPVTSRDDLERLADLGVDRVIVRPWRRTSDALESLSRFAEELLPAAEAVGPARI